MASVTPGVLLKLLQAMHTDDRVAGDHRSPVLQVTAVVPALTASTADSLWPPNGFLLQLSDGLHSTYVQLPADEADALVSARPQLVGHLVHLDRLRFARPVPRALGIRPVPSSRSVSFVGTPEPLVARPAACSRGYVIQPGSHSDAAPPLMPSGSGNVGQSDATDAVKRTVVAPKNVPEAAALPASSAAKRRFSSPAPSKQRDPSPALKGASRPSSPSVKGASRPSSPAVRGTSRATSPAPSKCVVPSLAAAKEENRRTAREPAIVVPSRYRQPSPVGGRKGAASPAPGGRRASLSPSSRRLSGEGSSKKKVAGISKMTDLTNGSAVKPGRKSWDNTSTAAAAGSVMKSKVKVDKDTILRTQEAMARRLSDVTTELSSNDGDSSVDEKPKPRKKTESTSVKTKAAAPKIVLHDPKWTDGTISLDGVSDVLSKMGKEASERRHAAAIAAVDALQEALITESVIRNLSKFSELSSASKTSNPLPTVDIFLAIYEDTLKWKKISESIATSGTETVLWENSTTHWVEAALATDLEVLKLMNRAPESFSRKRGADKPKVLSVVEPPKTTLSKRQSHGAPAKVQSKVSPSPTAACTWNKTQGVNETADLATTLCREMHTWFLKFVDEAMDLGFHLFEDQNIASRGKQSSHITMVLSQFKKISDWLDGVGKIAEEATTKDKVEQLKCKIYGFVINHMGSAFESSVSVSSRS
ncbi:treacle protein-like [Oryza brachyantha]|uniref:treacle protein-like n=1 Tax=Oryza brachyantha TaxID=4533 RepID=UPI001ADC00EF|nr:treacle protein-like [Oryza brachyantha]